MSDSIFFGVGAGFFAGTLLSIVVISVDMLRQLRRMNILLRQMVPLVQCALEDEREGL